MMAASGAERKREIRTRRLAARRALPATARQAADRRLHALLATIVGTRAGGGTITGYVPMPAEPGGPDLPAVLAAAVGPAGRVLLPVLRPDRDLDWVPFRPGPAGAGGPAREPAGGPATGQLPPVAVVAAGLLVIPAVAVDRHGVRLGRGGGSYDRVLARLPAGIEVIALLYEDELLDDRLPDEPHDRRVTAALVPERGLVRLPIET